jgi:hypothetical protein
MTYHALVAEFKRRLIDHALAAAGGSEPGAAALLGLARGYFYRMRHHGVGRPAPPVPRLPSTPRNPYAPHATLGRNTFIG